ncbi:hypothetical protein VNO78_09528 [Psophocarpus tetragonolobus]|uniref:Uncharacterized protein n=1 Tax=Psophocarpus tetragonolobus TaxID=3891 RepID=A0AAN9XTL5_PSOTE
MMGRLRVSDATVGFVRVSFLVQPQQIGKLIFVFPWFKFVLGCSSFNCGVDGLIYVVWENVISSAGYVRTKSLRPVMLSLSLAWFRASVIMSSM